MSDFLDGKLDHVFRLSFQPRPSGIPGLFDLRRLASQVLELDVELVLFFRAKSLPDLASLGDAIDLIDLLNCIPADSFQG